MRGLIQTAWLVLRLRCEEADRVRAKREEATGAERLGEKLHSAMCASCRAARRQLELVEDGLGAMSKDQGSEDRAGGPGLDQGARDRIAARLREADRSGE